MKDFRIEGNEYLQRVNALREKMAEANVDLVVGFSNLLEIAIVRYYCGFAPVNESALLLLKNAIHMKTAPSTQHNMCGVTISVAIELPKSSPRL